MNTPGLVEADDLHNQYAHLVDGAEMRMPTIGIKIKVTGDVKHHNNQIIKLLENGCSALLLDLRSYALENDSLAQLLYGVDLTLIESIFWIPEQSRHWFDAQIKALLNRDEKPSDRIYRVASNPGLKHILRADSDQDASDQICQILNFALNFLQNDEFESTELPILLPLSDDYLENIVKLRTLMVLFDLLQTAIDHRKCVLRLHGYAVSKETDHKALISIASQGISAFCGNAAGLFLGPWIQTKEDLDLAKLAVHSALVMQYETDLFEEGDPASGSFYFEKRTNELAESAWNQFKASLS